MSDELARLLDGFSKESKDTVTVGTLVRSWAGLVSSVSGVYEWTLDEYVDELSSTTRLERVLSLPGLTSEERESLRRRLDPLDQRFRESTREIDRPLWTSAGKDQWWNWRVPVRLGEEIALDLEGLGIES